MTDTGPGRTALITGASAGLGAEFARQLAAQGWDLILTARREDKLAALAETLSREEGVRCELLTADLSLADAPAALVRAIGERGLTVDCLINNAGAAGPDLLEHRHWQDHEAYYRLMLLSVLELCQALIPGMRDRGFGRVINVASVAGRMARPGDCTYGPVKAHLVALSEELALTLAGTGVHVSALCPGFTHTEFHEVAGTAAWKARSPRWLWYDADVVVREGLAAVEAGRSIQISGRLYRWLDPLLQSVWTRPWLKRLSGRAAPSQGD